MTEFLFKTKPYAHQLHAWEISKDEAEFALLMDLGTGKSKVLIDTLAWLYSQGKIDGALILAPKGCYRNMFNSNEDGVSGEIPIHMPDFIKYKAAFYSSYQTSKKLRELESLFKKTEDLHILVMNTEALSSKTGVDFAKRFLRAHYCLMAVDESTMIKNRKAKRTKATIDLGGLAKYRRIMSGRPVTQSPLDLYSQCLFLNHHLLGFSSYFSFQNRYALLIKMQMGQRVFDKIVGFQRVDELVEKIKPFSFRISKEQCLDLPGKIYQTRDVELTPEQQGFYAQLKNLALVQLAEAQFITVPMMLTRIQKLQEIVCGFIRNPDTGEVTSIPNNRIKTVLEILEETGDKVIIWSNNTYDMTALHSAISEEYGPESVACYYGATPDDERELIRKRFQDPSDSLRFFISNPATGKFGVTLTEAKTVIYYSNSYNLEDRLQSEARAHRIGQKDVVVYIDLITRNTTDEKIVKVLHDKKELSDLITLDPDAKRWLE